MLLKELFPQINDDRKFEQISKDCSSCGERDVYFCLTENDEEAKKRSEIAKRRGATVVGKYGDIHAEDVRKEFSLACKKFYANACDNLKIIGVTGTNGKTSTTHIIAEILKRNNKKVGIIGTLGVFYDGKTFESPLTTPDADFLHKTFFEMKSAGVEYVVMEVSAHAIDQKRIEGINFEVGVLTNITQDHLDYFKTMENYTGAKLKFFTENKVKQAILCVDDEGARNIISRLNIPVKTYGLNMPSDAFAIDVCCTLNGTHYIANINDEVLDIKTNLVGQYNVLNCLAAMLACQSLGLNETELKRGMGYIKPIDGRFNIINFSGKYLIVDYAHTPDGLEKVLQTARQLTDKKLFVIFGCGGNRDKSKRPQMGEIAEKFADCVCLTDDNPRFEQSKDIIKDIETGMKKPHFVEPERYDAIKKMINLASSGDIIVVAGKGAEKYQEINGEKRAYSDFDAIYAYFKELSPERPRAKECYDC